MQCFYGSESPPCLDLVAMLRTWMWLPNSSSEFMNQLDYLHFRGFKLEMVILSCDWSFFESRLFLHQLGIILKLPFHVGLTTLNKFVGSSNKNLYITTK